MKQIDELYPEKGEVLTGYSTQGTVNGKLLLVDKNKMYFDDGRPSGYLTLRSRHLANMPRILLNHQDYIRSGLPTVKAYVEAKLTSNQH